MEGALETRWIPFMRIVVDIRAFRPALQERFHLFAERRELFSFRIELSQLSGPWERESDILHLAWDAQLLL